MKTASCDADDSNAEASVQEGLIEIFSLKGRHAAIFTSLTIEDEVCGNNGSAHDGCTIYQSLCKVSSSLLIGWLIGRLLVGALEGIVEDWLRLCDLGGGGGCWLRVEERIRFGWRVVEEPNGW